MASQRQSHASVLAFLMVLSALLTACGGAGQAGNKGVSKSAVLVLKCDIQEAEVWINSRYSRSASELARGLRLAPGNYRVEVRHDGFHSRYFEIELRPKERRALEVTLARRF